MNNNAEKIALLEAQYEALTKYLNIASRAFNCKQFTAIITIVGDDNQTGEQFHNLLPLDQTDAEIVRFFNDYAATLAAKRLQVWQTLETLKNSQVAV